MIGACAAAFRAPFAFAGLAALVALAALATLGACRSTSSAALTPAQCEELVDAYVALVVREVNADASPAVLRAQQERVRAEARRDPALAQCTTEITRAKHACAMASTSAEAFEKCLE